MAQGSLLLIFANYALHKIVEHNAGSSSGSPYGKLSCVRAVFSAAAEVPLFAVLIIIYLKTGTMVLSDITIYQAQNGALLFTIPLARRFKRVASVESHGAAVRDMEHNAGQAGLSIGVHRAQAEQYLERLKSAPDFILADPPRRGLGKLVTGNLLRLSPPRIHIVSCDPSTLAPPQPLVAFCTARQVNRSRSKEKEVSDF